MHQTPCSKVKPFNRPHAAKSNLQSPTHTCCLGLGCCLRLDGLGLHNLGLGRGLDLLNSLGLGRCDLLGRSGLLGCERKSGRKSTYDEA